MRSLACSDGRNRVGRCATIDAMSTTSAGGPASFPEPGPLPRTAGVPPQHARPQPVPRSVSPRVTAFAEAARSATTAAAREAQWRELVGAGTPLVEPLDSHDCLVTFLWRGPARRVAALVNKLSDASTLESALLEPVPDTDAWALTLRLGRAFLGSYALAVVPVDVGEATAGTRGRAEHGGLETRRARALAVSLPERHEAIAAWFNLLAHAAPDPLAREHGGGASVARGPDAPRAPVVAGPVSPGRLVPAALPGGRRGWWHVPAGPPPAGWDVRVLLDGEHWLEPAAPGSVSAAPRLDALPAQGAPRRVTLLVEGGDMAARGRDLTCSPHMVDALRGALDGADPALLGAPLTADPARTSIVGRSLGGLLAVYAQCRAPERFGVSVSQSGSFWWPNTGGTAGSAGQWLTTAIESSAVHLGRVHLEVGTREWVLLEPTRRLREVLRGRATVTWREFDGGHDQVCWDALLPDALRGAGA